MLSEQFYETLFLIRRVEEEAARIYPTDKIRSPMHLSIGQESVSVGVCAALRAEDVVFGTYRCHALYLAKGGDLKKMVAELYGKYSGCAKGKGGSMHLIDPAAGVLGSSAIVGTTIPQAVGYALALKYQRKPAIVACFFGDGAVEEGAFHESLNFAVLKKLPILFVCENNFYAIHSHILTRQPTANVIDRAKAYGIPVAQHDGNDIAGLHTATKSAADAIRNGGGPQFFECLTYRWREHVGIAEDYHTGYRTREEAQPWHDNDPVAKLAAQLDAQQRQAIEARVEERIRESFAYAEAEPFPEVSALYEDVLKES
ncbi:MAG: thiamine pyrophosphate-dependent dehydrogenase E1 component subunit alpha [Verrucomicrobiota bacterium]